MNILQSIQQKIQTNPWAIVRVVNIAGLVMLAAVIVVSLPGVLPDQQPDPLGRTIMAGLLVWLLSQIMIVYSIDHRCRRIERLMVEIDAENDRRDNLNFHHVEVVKQDVAWLVKRRLADEARAVQTASAGQPATEYDSRDIPS